ncbi:MAG: adenine deaminase [Bacteroidetes bacterium OLB11]|nr:MAG: adenine deaminase [Bacteroidetes bacterium OLB11]
MDIAGLMSTQKVEYVSNQYTQINTAAQSIGCTLHAPFMTLSFMALLVIPQLKLSDKGLFDGNSFSFTELY